MSHIFLSYSHKDNEYTQKLHDDIRTQGYPVWRDVHIMPGDKWMQGITKAIQECALFIVIMSPSSDLSNWVKREIVISERFEKPTIPLLLAGDTFVELSDIQFEDVIGGKLPSLQFYETISKYLKADLPVLSQDEEIKTLKEQIAKLQSLVDDSQEPVAMLNADGVTDKIREGMRERLIDLAKKGETITYKSLGMEFGLREPFQWRHVVPKIIGNISVQENIDKRPLLSVLVVNQERGIPGTGFYSLARYLKPEYIDVIDDMKILTDEMNLVFDTYKNT